jgi:hypothetical protein
MVQAGKMTENSLNDEVKKELAFFKLYRELTGASESLARSVFMFTGCRESQNPPLTSVGCASAETKKTISTVSALASIS